PYVSRLCGPIALQDGPDAAQEALITVFRDIRQLREPRALYGWVRTIAVREAVRAARRARTGSMGGLPPAAAGTVAHGPRTRRPGAGRGRPRRAGPAVP